jgi:hypothetical protein
MAKITKKAKAASQANAKKAREAKKAKQIAQQIAATLHVSTGYAVPASSC